MKQYLPYLKWPGIVLGSVILILFVALIMVGFGFQERVYPRISVGSVSIGGKSIVEARALLEQEANRLKTTEIELISDTSFQEVTLDNLGVTILYDQSLVEAYKLKRNEPLRGLLSIFRADRLDWNYTLAQDTIQETIQQEFLDPLPEARNASLTYASGSIEITSGTTGATIDESQLVASIFTALTNNQAQVEVPITEQAPEVTTETLESLLPSIQQIVRDHTIYFEDQEWIISPQELVRWIQIEQGSLDLSDSLAKEYLRSISDGVARNPRNAKLRFNAGTEEIDIIQAGQSGAELMISESSRRLRDNILEEKRMTELFVAIEEPEIYEGNIDQLGIKTLLGSGQSDFVGSSTSRVANINVAANQISGTLIAPGEDFSFVETLGPVNAATGYFPELVIKGDKTIPEYGGGVCQVSTTLFRAALNSSLEITERRAHSYVVQYYGTPGLDATIYVPKPDFRFKNTTNHHILIQHYIVGTNLYYEVYGTDTGKESKIIGPIVLESNPDGSMKTVAYREIYQNGELLTKDSFYSNYRPPNKVNTNPLE